MDRRGFLGGVAHGAVLLGLASTALAQPSPPALRQRRNVSTMAPDDPDLLALRAGVGAMGPNFDADVMTQWRDLANMHWHPEGEPSGGLARRYWKRCQHGNEHFLPFHRAFLLLFETLIRRASGYAAFSLPYWDGVGDPVLPEAFRLTSINGQPNPLYHKRDERVNAGLPINAPQKGVAGIIDGCGAFRGVCKPREGDWGGFGGQGESPGVKGEVENAPHNWIHGEIKGDMNDPNTAARDPIFWLHHANIDRLWVVWRGRNPAHVDPTDRWKAKRWAFGNPLGRGPSEYAWRTEQLLDTRALPSGLSYQYDDETNPEVPGPNLRATQPRGAPARPQTQIADTVQPPIVGSAPGGAPNTSMPPRMPGAPHAPSAAALARFGAQTLGAAGANATFDLRMLGVTPPMVGSAPGGSRAPPSAPPHPTLALVLRGVRVPRDGPTYEIYLNLSDRAVANATPFFVGAITAWEATLKAEPHHTSGHRAMNDPFAGAFVFPLESGSGAALGGSLNISIVPVGAAAANGETLSFDSAEIVALP